MMDDIDTSTDLLKLVEQVGPQLVNSDLEIRLSGVRTLEQGILRSPVDALDEGQVKSLTEFMHAKLADHHSICSPALRSLVHLTASPALPLRSAVEVCQQLFSEVQTQSLNQTDRHCVYSILQNILSRYCPELVKEMSHDFVFGFIQTIEGERDPRNLLVTFQTAEAVIKRFNIDRFVEDIFDVLACYFPVVFVPPPNDSRGITREMLVEANRACLVASPKFAPFLLPLVLEKLQENEAQARRDALELLALAVPTYSLDDLRAYERSMIDCFQREITRGGQPEIERAVHAALISFTKTFGELGDGGDENSALSDFVDQVFKVSAMDLVDDDMKRNYPTGKLLLSMASAHPHALKRLSVRAVPHVLQTKKNEVFLTSLLDLARTNSYSAIEDLLGSLKEESEDWTGFVASLSLQLRLILLPNFMSEQRAEKVVSEAMDCLRDSAEIVSDKRRIDIVNLLATVVACHRAEDIMETNPPTTNIGEHLLHRWKTTISTRGVSSTQRTLAQELLIACGGKSSSLCFAIIEWLIAELRTSDNDTRTDLLKCLSRVVLEISDETRMAKISDLVLENVDLLEADHSKAALEEIVDMMWHLTASSNVEFQSKILNAVLGWSTKDRISRTMLKVSCAVLCPLSVEVSQGTDNLIINRLFDLSKTLEEASHAYASLLNKTAANTASFSRFEEHLSSLEWESATSYDHLWFVMVTRALVMRNHARSEDLLRRLLSLLDSSRQEIVVWTSQRLHLLVRDLPKTFYCGVEFILSTHKCFMIVISHLSPRCTSVKDEKSQLLVNGLAQLTSHVKEEIVLADANTILPLLMRALTLGNFPEAQQAALKVLQAIAESPSHSSTIASYADDFLPALLPMLGESPVDCRLNAARLLQSCLPRLNHMTLRVHRPTVLRQLARAANDRKRVVRKEAMHARNMWLVVAE